VRPARLNSPISARQRVEKLFKVREGGTEAATRTSPLAKLQTLALEQEHQIEHLKEKLAAAERRDGSLFDLRKDRIEDIISTIIHTVTEHRAKQIAAGITAHYKKPKPAG
jgi:hypothetical protein